MGSGREWEFALDRLSLRRGIRWNLNCEKEPACEVLEEESVRRTKPKELTWSSAQDKAGLFKEREESQCGRSEGGRGRTEGRVDKKQFT